MNTIRNFSIIAHIDHGKTTLTDRLLEFTDTITKREAKERMMDSNPIEQERGVTIKLAPVRMETNIQDKNYILNLIDTPGHVDFGYEVSRSLAACEGAILLVDATQGVQAQTLSHFQKAKQIGLHIIPVLNKIDLPASDPDSVTLELMELCGIEEENILCVSAKTGENVDKLCELIVSRVPQPQGDKENPLRVLVFTSTYDQHKGVIAYIRVVDGVLTKQNLVFLSNKVGFTPTEIGVFKPKMKPVEKLEAGEVGYIATGLKEVEHVRVGDTITNRSSSSVSPLPGYKEPLSMVFMDLYPVDGDDYSALLDAMDKLKLHDAALQFKPTHSPALGNGLRVGFLGIFHAEIVRERLEREFNLDLVATTPSVTYKITINGEEIEIHHAAELPDVSLITKIREPITKTTIFTPKDYVGEVMMLCESSRGKVKQILDVGVRMRMEYEIPLAELITGFHDRLKSVSSGFASMEYEVTEFKEVEVVKLDIIVQHERIDALSQLVVRDKAETIGRKIAKKLKKVIPRQQFEVPIQAAIGGKIIARETIKAYRKDVTAKLYGGDITRRKKLLEKQKKGKKRMKQFGKVELNQDAFMAVLER